MLEIIRVEKRVVRFVVGAAFILGYALGLLAMYLVGWGK
jgi:hypothetical protein